MAYQAEVSDIRGGKWSTGYSTECEAELTLSPEDMSVMHGIGPGDLIEITVIKKKEGPYA